MQKIYFNHDGNVDDLVSLILLLAFPDTEIVGVSTVGADSYVEPPFRHRAKLSIYSVRLANSKWPNPTPGRSTNFLRNGGLSAFSFDDFPILNEYLNEGNPQTRLAKQPAHLDMVQKLQQSSVPVTLVMTVH